MRVLRRGIWLGLAGVVWSCGVAVSDQLPEQRELHLGDGLARPGFAFGAIAVDNTDGNRTLVIRISYPQFLFGKSSIRITVPKGLTVESGQLVRETVPEVDTEGHPWFIKLSGKRPGRYRVAGSLRIHCSDHIDEAEWELPIVVDQGRITAGSSDPKRFERVDGSGRYRYGYQAMVPLEGPQRFSQEYIEKHGIKPRPLETPDGLCPACALEAPTTVGCLVVVDRHGHVVSAKAVRGEEDLRLREAAEVAVRKWKFAPGRVGSVRISDWTGVDVVVR
jgi:Periplasmic protein TonB, links inner and outer membranes